MNEVLEKPVILNNSPEIRTKILSLEEQMRKLPGAMIGDSPEYLEKCPLKHTFVDGFYIRELSMPKRMLFISKIHKKTHPYFILKGDVSVLTENGIVRIKSPFQGITLMGTKRVIYTHEDSVWITIHLNPDNTQDLKKLEEMHIAKTFDELPNNIIEALGEVLQLEETK